MEGYEAQLVLVLVLIALNALFAGSEIALITLREGQLKQLEESGPGGRAAARLARDPNRFLATIQIGITLAGFLASATAAVALARPLVEPLGFLGRYAAPVAVVSVTVLLTFVTLVLGELAPKRIAMQRAEGWATLVARPLNLIATLSRPAVWLLGVTTNVVVRIAGVDPRAAREEVSEEELREMISDRRDISPEQRTILSGAFEIGDRMLRHVLVPRREMDTVPCEASAGQALQMLAERGHSRAPVVSADGMDEVVGITHWADLVGTDGGVRDTLHEPLMLPDSLSVARALRRLTARRQQMAVVIGESGEVAGIVSLEDLLEEVVGEIYDETDRDPGPARLAGGELRLAGTHPVHDLPALGVELEERPEGSYVTVAGLVLLLLGYIPSGPGASVGVGGWTFTVTEADGRVVSEVLVSPSGDHGER
ncbi:HlyC/CorC family transporter [Nocardiopsis sp. HNM0947]|uniref:HlyC/CorC family transporter n=1 Tax=Nocardiopsis coralli TaxID=2772213 RepID=A0ABR9P478_9ACTN|nr:hemolysin family protein [Nocardiopsis coralli]MBE2998617.1 HlyC/CorC family transporter [Nocardiopsis coralli]